MMMMFPTKRLDTILPDDELKRGFIFFLAPVPVCGLEFAFARQIDCPVPSQPDHALCTKAESYTYSRAPLLPPTFRDGVHLYYQPPSGQS